MNRCWYAAGFCQKSINHENVYMCEHCAYFVKHEWWQHQILELNKIISKCGLYKSGGIGLEQLVGYMLVARIKMRRLSNSSQIQTVSLSSSLPISMLWSSSVKQIVSGPLAILCGLWRFKSAVITNKNINQPMLSQWCASNHLIIINPYIIFNHQGIRSFPNGLILHRWQVLEIRL